MRTSSRCGRFGCLSKAHIASALAGDLAVAGRAADTDARAFGRVYEHSRFLATGSDE